MKMLRLGASLGALGGQLGGQWERERRDTLFLMATIALAVLPHVAYLPLWVVLTFALTFGWRLAIVFSGHEMPASWIRTLGAVGCLAAVFADFGSFIGREQGVAMLTLFLGLKLLEMKARRDLFVVVFLCFFLLLTSFFHSQSMLSTALVLIAVTALTSTMITMQFGDHEPPIPGRLRQAAVMMLQALPIAIALFVLFPRLATPLWGVPGQGNSASTGLSSSMSPGGVSSLSKSTAIAMRVNFDETVPPRPSRYWRGPVFGAFDGTTWRALDPAATPRAQPELKLARDEPAISYEVTMEPNGQPWLLALDMPSRIEPLGQGSVSIGSGFSLERNRPIYERTRYRLESHLDYALGATASESSLQPWLQLPVGFNPRTMALAQTWRSEMEGQPAQDVVQRALDMFNQQNFVYTLNPPLLGRNSVDDFLFDQQAGFCEHFSSSFVVLMRAMGIPARVITGYQGGEINPVDGYMVVRQSDAHAWAEVWIDGKGWLRFDPTAAVAPERVESDQRLVSESALTALAAGSSLWQIVKVNFDALANTWNQLVLNYDRSSQSRLLDGLGFDGQDWEALAWMLAGAMVLLVGGSMIFSLQPRAIRDDLAVSFDLFCGKLANFGLERHSHETPAKFLDRASRQLNTEVGAEARNIVRMYTRLRYGDMSGVYQGKERRRRSRSSVERARHISEARELMRHLKLAVKRFNP